MTATYLHETKDCYLGSFIIDKKIYDAYESKTQIIARYGNKPIYKLSIDKEVLKHAMSYIERKVPPLLMAVILHKIKNDLH